MNPPVEAPASSTRRPVTSRPKTSSAWSSFSPPRLTNRGRADRRRRPRRRRAPGGTALSATAPFTRTRWAAMSVLRFGAARHQLTPDEFGVEPSTSRHRSISRPACSERRPPSWPEPSSQPAFLAGAFFAARLLGRSLLGGSLLGRSLLRSRAFLAGAFFAGAALVTSALTRSAIFSASSSKRSSSSSKRSESQATCLENSLLACSLGGLATAVEERLHRLLGVLAPDLAGLHHRLNDGLGLLAGHLGELDASVDQSLQCCFCHDRQATRPGQGSARGAPRPRARSARSRSTTMSSSMCESGRDTPDRTSANRQPSAARTARRSPDGRRPSGCVDGSNVVPVVDTNACNQVGHRLVRLAGDDGLDTGSGGDRGEDRTAARRKARRRRDRWRRRWCRSAGHRRAPLPMPPTKRSKSKSRWSPTTTASKPTGLPCPSLTTTSTPGPRAPRRRRDHPRRAPARPAAPAVPPPSPSSPHRPTAGMPIAASAASCSRATAAELLVTNSTRRPDARSRAIASTEPAIGSMREPHHAVEIAEDRVDRRPSRRDRASRPIVAARGPTVASCRRAAIHSVPRPALQRPHDRRSHRPAVRRAVRRRRRRVGCAHPIQHHPRRRAPRVRGPRPLRRRGHARTSGSTPA